MAVADEMDAIHVLTRQIVIERDVLNRELLNISCQKREVFGILERDTVDTKVFHVLEIHDYPEEHLGIINFLAVGTLFTYLGQVVPVPYPTDYRNSLVTVFVIGIGQQVCTGVVGRPDDRVPVNNQRLPGVDLQYLLIR